VHAHHIWSTSVSTFVSYPRLTEWEPHRQTDRQNERSQYSTSLGGVIIIITKRPNKFGKSVHYKCTHQMAVQVQATRKVLSVQVFTRGPTMSTCSFGWTFVSDLFKSNKPSTWLYLKSRHRNATYLKLWRMSLGAIFLNYTPLEIIARCQLCQHIVFSAQSLFLTADNTIWDS